MKTPERLGLSLEEDPPVKIHGIEENMEMKANIVQDFGLSLDEDTWKWDIIVGPALNRGAWIDLQDVSGMGGSTTTFNFHSHGRRSAMCNGHRSWF